MCDRGVLGKFEAWVCVNGVCSAGRLPRCLLLACSKTRLQGVGVLTGYQPLAKPFILICIPNVWQSMRLYF